MCIADCCLGLLIEPLFRDCCALDMLRQLLIVAVIVESLSTAHPVVLLSNCYILVASCAQSFDVTQCLTIPVHNCTVSVCHFAVA